MDWQFLIFLFFASLTCGFALGALVAQNVVRMAFFLVLSLGASSGLFFLAGAEFVGAMQLMIYVGGTLVLLVFGVMLTASDAAIALRSSTRDWVLGCVPSAAIFVLLASSALSVPRWNEPQPAPSDEFVARSNDQTARIGLAFLGLRLEAGEVGALAGHPSGYLLPFEIVSIHLLVALIGAGYLARAKRRRVTHLPDSIAVRSAPTWYVVTLNVLVAATCVKAVLYLLAPALVERATHALAPPAIVDELSSLPSYWLVPAAAAVAIVAAGLTMLRFGKGSGWFVQAIGFGVAACQFWNWGAETTATATAVGGVAFSALLGVAFLSIAGHRSAPREVAA